MSYIVKLADLPERLDSIAPILDKIVEGDCLELMRRMPDKCVDAVITDPPYNLGKKYDLHDDSMPEAEFNEWLTTRFREAARALRNGGVSYFTCSTQMMRLCESWEFFQFRQWMVWYRPNLAGSGVFAMGDWKRMWEPIYYGGKGCFRAKLGVFPDVDVFVIPTPQSNFTNGRHGICERPVRLIESWLARANAETILDPFLGSGTTAVAAKKLGRHFIGCEISPEYCRIAERRLLELDAQPNLFEPQKKVKQMDLLE